MRSFKVATTILTALLPALAALPGRAASDCDATRPAVAHHAGARLISNPGPAPYPCLYRTGFEGWEPSLGVDAAGTIFVNGDRTFTGNAVPRPAVLRSTDGGITWKVASPHIGTVRTHQVSLDPYLYVDKVTGRVFSDDIVPPGCSFFSFTDDGGKRWTNTLTGCEQADHETVFAGRPVWSRTIGYPNVVYRCAISGGQTAAASTASACSKSLDGGMTFIPSGAPPFTDDPRQRKGDLGIRGHCDGPHGHGFAGPDGTIYLPRGWCGQPWLAISRSEGLTWKRVRVATNGMALSDDGIWEHEAGVAADADGDLYYVWLARDRLPYLAISRDRGAHWSAPMMVAPPGVRETALPGIDIGPDGRIAIVYIGSTNSPGPPFAECDAVSPACVHNLLVATDPALVAKYRDVTWNGYISLTFDPLATDPIFYSASVNDPADPIARGVCGPTTQACSQGDFLDIVVAGDGTPWASFIDGCERSCVHPATEGDKQENGHDGLVGRLAGL